MTFSTSNKLLSILIIKIKPNFLKIYSTHLRNIAFKKNNPVLKDNNICISHFIKIKVNAGPVRVLKLQ